MIDGLKKCSVFILYATRGVVNRFIDLHEVSILCYHSVDDTPWNLSISSEMFDKQIKFLKSNYYIATLDEVVDYISKGRRLPHKTVAITFDDGYTDNLKNALPILEKYNAPATIFVVGNLSNDNPTHLNNNLEILNKEDLYELEKSALIKIEWHSNNHKLLSRLSHDEIKKEIESDRGYSYFAYPGGHYSQNAISCLKSMGYKAAFSIKPGLVNVGDDLFLIKRNVIEKGQSFWEFKFRLSKALEYYTRITRIIKEYA